MKHVGLVGGECGTELAEEGLGVLYDGRRKVARDIMSCVFSAQGVVERDIRGDLLLACDELGDLIQNGAKVWVASVAETGHERCNVGREASQSCSEVTGAVAKRSEHVLEKPAAVCEHIGNVRRGQAMVSESGSP